MFNRNFDRLFDMMRGDMREFRGHDLAQYDGYRVEIVNGEATEFVYDDGEWQQLGEEDSDDESSDVEVIEGDDDTATVVADLGAKVEDDAIVTEATLNNGIFEATLETSVGSDEGDSDE